MSLQTKLDQIKAEFKQQADQESLTLMGKAAEQLARSSILAQALQSGDRMPDFTLAAARGGEIDSAHLLEQGPLVVSFYRGVW